jgi:tetratricopeptide (TPR) repeat protein
VATLESALKQWPDHPGANHYYIHAVEASTRPERGLTAAGRLGDLVPGAGHLVHMPAHIYIRTGKYHAASEANEQAIAADRGYITQCRQQGIYPLMYHPHNWHFLAVTATLEGRKQRAVQAARQMAKIVRGHMRGEYTTLQHFFSVQYFVLTKFGMWDTILKETPPPAELAYPNGIWRFARGMAFTGLNRLDEAAQELAVLKKIAADESLREETIWGANNYYDLLGIAVNVLSGELAAAQKEYDPALEHLRAALAGEEKLYYDEPASWFPPVRHNMAAVLLQAGRAAEAEAVCRADLRRYPDNGWTLFSLSRCLAAQGKTQAAEQIRAEFRRAWQHADIKAETILP